MDLVNLLLQVLGLLKIIKFPFHLLFLNKLHKKYQKMRYYFLYTRVNKKTKHLKV